jgi:trehalose/maltose transport system substrate-binding protein
MATKSNISKPSNSAIRISPFNWPGLLKIRGVSVLLLGFCLGGCRPSSQEPVTLTFLDPEWSHDLQVRRAISDEALQEFTRQTGIRVKHLPAPETSPEQLALTRDLLEKRAVAPDVYGIDVIWPGILGDYLLDLKPYFTSELSSEDPEVVANYTVLGKLVAMPYHANIGILFYRADLLRRYGYNEPPRTWDELEKIAVRVQAGERSKGERDFWGYVWPGAAGEGLTCLALEWQVDEGGGHIIEPDKKISVNNPNAIRAWERAEHWVGRISPPSVISYQEWDASNAFWIKGRAAFFRGWTSDYFLTYPLDVPFRDQSGITSVPGGKSARVATLGGFGLGVSRSSAHQREAIKLVQFLTRREAELERNHSQREPPTRPEIFELPALLKAFTRLGRSDERRGGGTVTRPSTITGQKYDDVSQAYARAVHSVLTGQSKALDAAAALEKELVRITGFETEHQ